MTFFATPVLDSTADYRTNRKASDRGFFENPNKAERCAIETSGVVDSIEDNIAT